MARFVKSTDEILRREHTVFRSLDHGPFTVWCHDDGVTARSADGLTVEVASNSVLGPADRQLLQSGVEVRTDGELVGHLTQTEHGFFRRSRVLNLTGLTPGRFPDGAHFRLRGYQSVSLEDQTGRLVRLSGRTQVKPSVTPEMLAIMAAVRVGLYEVLQQAVHWKPDNEA